MALSQLLTLKIKRHENIPSILLYDEKIMCRDLASKLKKERLFDEAIPYVDGLFYSSKTQKLLISELQEYFKNILPISENEIMFGYTSGEMACSFALYLRLINKKSFVIETRPGLIADTGRYEWAFKDGWISKAYYSLQKKLCVLSGEDGYNTMVLYPNSKILKGIQYEIFDYNTELSNIDKYYSEKILSCFDIDVEKLIGKKQLLLTNSISHCANTTIYGKELAPYVFQVLLDYYGSTGDLVVKQHPHDELDMTPFFTGGIEFNKNVPIELIRLIPDLKLNAIVSGYTTSAWRIKDLTCDYRQAGLKFFRLLHLIHDIKIAIDYCEVNNIEKVTTNIPSEMIEEFVKYNSNKISIVKPSDKHDGSIMLNSLLINIDNSEQNILVIDDDNKTEIRYKNLPKKVINLNLIKINNNSIAPKINHKLIILNDTSCKNYYYFKKLNYEKNYLEAKIDMCNPLIDGELRVVYHESIGGDIECIKKMIEYHDKNNTYDRGEKEWWSNILGERYGF